MSTPLDLSTRNFFSLPHFNRFRRCSPLLDPSLVLLATFVDQETDDVILSLSFSCFPSYNLLFIIGDKLRVKGNI
jgi:hypothetical protein